MLGKSENPQQTKGHQKKYQNEDFAKNGGKNFSGYTMMRKRRNVLHCLCLCTVHTGGSKHLEEDKGPFILYLNCEHQKC